ncbi:MAG TPA: glycerophosphodiester phosphodiesterase [Acidimicrobiales bacterium]
MLVLAHRGASVAFAENTLAAFEGAIAMGADGVELDVRRTADMALAVHHDDVLGDERVIVETRRADLPPSVPLLSDALATCEGLAVVNVEIKNWPEDRDFDPTEQVAEAVVALLAERGELDDGRILVSSFHLPTIDRVHELAPDLATAWLLGLVSDMGSLIATAAAHGHVAVHPHHAFVTEEVVRMAHDEGLAVNTWTCDDPDRIRELAALGVDAVVTNVPDVALAALSR